MRKPMYLYKYLSLHFSIFHPPSIHLTLILPVFRRKKQLFVLGIRGELSEINSLSEELNLVFCTIILYREYTSSIIAKRNAVDTVTVQSSD